MSVQYYGDFAEDDTVNIPFNTFDSNDPTASVTITNLVAADIMVHKDGGLTQIATDGATVIINFDGITGNHLITIDTSAHADYTTGSEYQVRIEGATVDGGTINAWIGCFSIERAGGTLALLKTLNIANGAVDSKLTYIMDTILTEGGAGRLAEAFVKLFDVATPLLVASDVMRGTDGANTTVPDAAGTAATPAEVATALTDIKLDHLVAIADNDDPVDNSIISKMVASDGDWSGYSAVTDSLEAIRDRGDVAWVTGAGGSGGATAASLAALDAKIGEPVNIDLGGATIADNLKKIADDNGGADFDATDDSLNAIRTRGDSAWTTGAGGSDRLLMVDTTIATLASQVSFTLTAGSADNNAYRNCTIVIEDATTAAQKAIGLIASYVGSTKTVTLKYDPAVFTMQATDKIYILAENALKSADANRQLNVSVSGNAGLDWGNLESPDTVIDLSETTIKLCDTVTANTDMRGTDGANTTVPDAAGTAAVPGDAMNLADDAIKATSYDESTAFPIVFTDTGSTKIARTGADSDTLETLSDEVAAIPTTAMRGTDNAATEAKQDIMDTNIDQIETAVITNAAGVDIAADIIALKAVADAIPTTAMRGTDNAATASALTTHDNKIGTPANIDGGGASISENLKKLADDNGGADYDATTDSQEAIRNRGDVAWITGGAGGGSNVTHIANATLTNMGGRNFELFFNNSDTITTKKVSDVGVAGSGFDPDTHDLGDGLMMTDAIRKTASILFGNNTLSSSDIFTCKDYGGSTTELVLTKTGNAVNRTTG